MSLRIAIFEDEPPAAAALEGALRRLDPRVEVALVAPSVRRALEGLRKLPDLDLIFADVRLSDGLSLRVFDEARPTCPAIFTTAYDAYVIQALERNAIDYLLKPIEDSRLAQAMSKYARLREHFGGKLAGLARELAGERERGTKILARSGASFVVVPEERVAWFTTEHKLTVLATIEGGRLLVDEPLAALEEKLGTGAFRLNRQFLACARGVKSFRPAGRGRLLVTLAPAADDDVLVSQEIAGAFRDWMQT
ncbi:MAG TPA: LytTR family DNA-binding domain-containing protein [Polyangiaceae bacterium]|jgi:DNA-binding LytR/AlgR family response regulator